MGEFAVGVTEVSFRGLGEAGGIADVTAVGGGLAVADFSESVLELLPGES